MKLSDFKGEEALDLMADLMEPATEIINDPQIKALKGQPYIKVAQYILKNHKKNSLAIYELLCKEDRKKATPPKILALLIDVLNDPDLQSLFTWQGQKMQEPSSGSATANTKENEK